MPSLTSLVNKVLYINKNFGLPGNLCNITIKKGSYNYILTPYMLYEIIKYKYSYENTDYLYLSSFYKKNISALKSKGINIFIC